MKITSVPLTKNSRFTHYVIGAISALALLMLAHVNSISLTELTSISAAHAEDTPANEEQVDINTATEEQLKTLKGIGKTLAKRIVDDRKANGPFKSVEDLRRVRGIGKRTLEKNIHRLKATQVEADQP